MKLGIRSVAFLSTKGQMTRKLMISRTLAIRAKFGRRTHCVSNDRIWQKRTLDRTSTLTGWIALTSRLASLVEDKRDRVVNDHTAGTSQCRRCIPHNHVMSIIGALVLTDLKLMFPDCKQIYIGRMGVSL